MRLLFDVGHPAHVHIFNSISKFLISNGHTVYFTVREGEKEANLLKANNWPYSVIGKKRNSFFGKIMGLFTFSYMIFRIAKKQKTDIFISHGSMYAGIAAFFFRKPHIALEDTGNMEQLFISKPFSDVILSPDSLKVDLGEKHIKYKGFHELYYLNPNYFFPNFQVKTMLGIQKDEKYCILRFISWSATHDHGRKGIPFNSKMELIETLKKRMKVFISSEMELPSSLIEYKFPLDPEWLHHALAFSEIVISEGATIASESTLLGVPVVYVNSTESDLIDSHEKNGLMLHYRNFEGVIKKVSEILDDKTAHSELLKKRDRMLTSRIDATAFLVWFVENYPLSYKIMKEDPEYQNIFNLNYS